MSKCLITSFFGFSLCRSRFVWREGKNCGAYERAAMPRCEKKVSRCVHPILHAPGFAAHSRWTSKIASYAGYLGFY